MRKYSANYCDDEEAASARRIHSAAATPEMGAAEGDSKF